MKAPCLSRIAIVGASGHGKVACDAAIAQGYDVVGFLDTYKPVGTVVLGRRILGRPDDLPTLMTEYAFGAVFLAISNNVTRQNVAERIARENPKLEFVPVVHPTAWISPSARIGAGALVLSGAIIHAECVIAAHAIINTRVALDHESVVSVYASLLPGVTTGGNVCVGERSCICVGSTLSHQVTIGRDVFVGAGSVVLGSLPDLVLAYGTPARVVRSRTADERHF